ncbi:FecR family protein [Daejeonella sp.]|uniref:FecR family protein n=1 Tax=Daejeonella sp. TaxID=2805397 RepID=UPI0030BBA5F2
MNYREFSIQDFVWDKNFRQWVLSPDADLDTFWEEWIIENPDKVAEVNAARQILKASKIKDGNLRDFEIEDSIAVVLNEIKDVEHSPVSEPHHKRPLRSSVIKHSLTLAASIVLLLSVASFYYFRDDATVSSNMIERVNNGPGLLQLNMHDGSNIILEKGARVSFAKSFTNLESRKIYLTGEAFFDVAKDPLKPFIVYSNGLITKVLGTKFRVRSYATEKNSVVEVVSGVVAVYSLSDKDSEDERNGEKLSSVILTRNQKANYSNEDRIVMATVVQQPVAINNRIFNYTFSDTPIKQIFKNIEEGYGLEIIYDEKVLAKRTLTADLSQVSMYDKLSIICKVLDTRYEIIDGKIIIYQN